MPRKNRNADKTRKKVKRAESDIEDNRPKRSRKGGSKARQTNRTIERMGD